MRLFLPYRGECSLALVPHFEKMLYDNAQLAVVPSGRVLNHQDERFEEVARDTLDYV